MLSEGEVNELKIEEYEGFDDLQKSVALPSPVGLYVWFFDFARLVGGSRSHIEARLRAFFTHQGRRIRSESDPFLDIEWRATRLHMLHDRYTHIVDALESGSREGQTFASLATRFQRPLYVGISTRLPQRIEEHLSGATRLRGSLLPLTPEDCVVHWTPLDAQDVPGINISTPIGVPPFAETDTPHADEQEPRDLPLPRQLAILESLLIRTSAPLHNEKMDS
jgi:hypothetical protein